MRWILPILVGALVGLAVVPAAEAATCHDATSSFTKLHSISCAQAKQVMHRARTALKKPPYMPECKGDPVARWNGWRFEAVGTLGIDVVATKGARGFHFGGGGACG